MAEFNQGSHCRSHTAQTNFYNQRPLQARSKSSVRTRTDRILHQSPNLPIPPPRRLFLRTLPHRQHAHPHHRRRLVPIPPPARSKPSAVQRLPQHAVANQRSAKHRVRRQQPRALPVLVPRRRLPIPPHQRHRQEDADHHPRHGRGAAAHAQRAGREPHDRRPDPARPQRRRRVRSSPSPRKKE